MDIIKKGISKIQHSMNFIHYLRCSITKNIYAYEITGEKIIPSKTGITISYKMPGDSSNKAISIQDLLNDKKLIEKFHPLDAFKLGSLAFEDIILKLPETKKFEKFFQIKNMMLTSTHDVDLKQNNQNSLTQFLHIQPKSTSLKELTGHFDSSIYKNAYPFKMVGGREKLKFDLTRF